MSYPAQAQAILRSRTVDQLKDAWREARRRALAGDQDANAARRWVTIELLRRLPRADVARFERRVRAIEEKAPYREGAA